MIRSNRMQRAISAQSLSGWQYANPLRMLRSLWHHRSLIRQITRREIETRYRGTFLGFFWLVINPLVLLLIYTFVFGVVFHSRWGKAPSQSLAQFALIVFCGLTAFNIFSECAGRAATIVIGVPNYVKKVVFPLEILPVCRLGAALFQGSIGLAVLLAANLLVNHTIEWTLIFLPVVMLPLIFFSLGVMWFLASLGVFLRDIHHVIVLVVQVMFFASAIFYPIEVLPALPQAAIRLNPLTSIVANFRRVILWGMMPSWFGLALWLLATGTVMMLGYVWFMKSKMAFADVI
jgi:lipopolysaccharide transport system permease protein